MNETVNYWDVGILYIGSYGERGHETVHVCRLDKSTGKLDIVQRLTGVENASYLALHPSGGRLYAVKENAETNGVPGGAVVSFAIDDDSGLLGEATEAVSSRGAHPCYVSVDEGGTALFVANYSGGNIALLPLAASGELQETADLVQHEQASGAVPSRQEAPHAHCITPLPGTSFVSAADLGMDAVVTYKYDEARSSLTLHHTCSVPDGAGPRHIVFHPRLPFAYATNELASSVSLFDVDNQAGTLGYRSAFCSVPSDYAGYNDAADIHISPDGLFLYSSNRGHNSIAVYGIDQTTGELAAVQHCGTGGEQPRNFGITPEGDFLLAANQKSGTVVVFRIDKRDGTLSQTGCKLEVPSPVCIRFGYIK